MADYLAWVKMAQQDYTQNDVAPLRFSSPRPVDELADNSATK
jgi:hypothetical protein